MHACQSKFATNMNHSTHPKIKDSMNSVKQLKEELAELLAKEAKADKLRSLPLYSCKMIGFKFVCSKCCDKVYLQQLHAIAKKDLNLS